MASSSITSRKFSKEKHIDAYKYFKRNADYLLEVPGVITALCELIPRVSDGADFVTSDGGDLADFKTTFLNLVFTLESALKQCFLKMTNYNQMNLDMPATAKLAANHTRVDSRKSLDAIHASFIEGVRKFPPVKEELNETTLILEKLIYLCQTGSEVAQRTMRKSEFNFEREKDKSKTMSVTLQESRDKIRNTEDEIKDIQTEIRVAFDRLDEKSAELTTQISPKEKSVISDMASDAATTAVNMGTAVIATGLTSVTGGLAAPLIATGAQMVASQINNKITGNAEETPTSSEQHKQQAAVGIEAVKMKIEFLKHKLAELQQQLIKQKEKEQMEKDRLEAISPEMNRLVHELEDQRKTVETVGSCLQGLMAVRNKVSILGIFFDQIETYQSHLKSKLEHLMSTEIQDTQSGNFELSEIWEKSETVVVLCLVISFSAKSFVELFQDVLEPMTRSIHFFFPATGLKKDFYRRKLQETSNLEQKSKSILESVQNEFETMLYLESLATTRGKSQNEYA